MLEEATPEAPPPPPEEPPLGEPQIPDFEDEPDLEEVEDVEPPDDEILQQPWTS